MGKKAKHTYNCIVCGKEKTIPMAWERKKENTSKFCSRECKRENQRDPIIEFECENCGKTKEMKKWQAEERKFCSLDCAYGNRKVDVKTGEYLECAVCEEEFYIQKSKTSRRKTCSRECFGEYFSKNYSGSDNPCWQGGKSRYYYGTNWYRMREKAWERDNYECQICGRDESELSTKPSVHHIKPIKEFENPEDANTLENLITVCTKHHKMIEDWKLKPDIR